MPAHSESGPAPEQPAVTMATITSSINYTAPLELYRAEKPFYSNVPAPDGRQSNQVAWKYDRVKFRDIRTEMASFTLDQNGFEIFQFGEEDDNDEARRFDSDAWVERSYYQVVEEVLKARFGNVHVKIFDHTVRRRKTLQVLQAAGEHMRATRQPSYSAHCDQTILSGENRIKFHTGPAAAHLLKKRCQIINVWRPLFGPLEDCPLTYCDWRTVDVGRDYMPADLIFPHYIGEQYLVTQHPDHRWYFLSRQRTNEFTLLKCWDNKSDVARCVAHTSFMNPNTPEGARLRESVEFRCLVFGQDH